MSKIMNLFNSLTQNVSDFHHDVLKIKAKEEAKLQSQSKSEPKIELDKNEKLKSLQRTTTFYKDEKQAKSIAQEPPAIKFVYKRIIEIFGG